jgi:hypothetical protein
MMTFEEARAFRCTKAGAELMAVEAEAEEEEEEEEEEETEPEEELETEPEPREIFIRQRRFLDNTRRRAINSLSRSAVKNPKDYETIIQIHVAQVAAIAFCNVKDSLGGQLAPTVEEMAKRCVNAEASSKKQNQLIEDLQDQLDEANRKLGQVKGGRK